MKRNFAKLFILLTLVIAPAAFAEDLGGVDIASECISRALELNHYANSMDDRMEELTYAVAIGQYSFAERKCWEVAADAKAVERILTDFKQCDGYAEMKAATKDVVPSITATCKKISTW